VKQSGRHIFFRLGGDQVSTRMYRSRSQLIEGWTKNLALLFSKPIALAMVRAAEFVGIVGSVSLAIASSARGNWPLAGWMATIFVLLSALFLRRIFRARFRWDATSLAVFGLPIFSFLLFRSVISYKRGWVTWKGRHYAGNGGS